ncbi:Protein 21.1 [Giardia lamblia P15]|uniref:Protein 21.1 n=1 Tax=Giardia intestinalis (strain P15) TaxID=658858 RepID=E1EX62_GIAIA|nr:Protein 21.1 [Giardia lamblia P15]
MHGEEGVDNGNYLWMNAIASGRLELVEASMVERTCPMPSGRPAIISAAEAGNTPLVALLLSQEKDLCDSVGRTALMHAVIHNHLTTAKELLLLAGRQTNDGISALMYAAWRGHLQLVELLACVKNGVELGLQRANGETALMTAIRMGHKNCALVLIKSGRELNKQMTDGTTALMLAKTRDIAIHLLCEVSLLRKGGLTALMTGAMQDLDEVVELLAPHLRNRRSHEGYTALMLAARHGNAKSVKILIEKTDELGLQDKQGRSALMLAAHHGSKHCVELLLKGEGHLVDYKNRRASAYTTNDDLRLLLGLFNMGDVDTEGLTTLMHAARLTRPEVVEKLVGTQLKAQDSIGRTALMYACLCGREDSEDMVLVVSMLSSEAGLCDSHGRSALFYLIDNSHVHGFTEESRATISSILLFLSPELSLVGPKDLRPLDYAITREKYIIGALIYSSTITFCTENITSVRAIMVSMLNALARRIDEEYADSSMGEDAKVLTDFISSSFCDDGPLLAEELADQMESMCRDTELPGCCICLEQEAEEVMVPCGHLTCCRSCLPKAHKVCPVCRAPVRTTITPLFREKTQRGKDLGESRCMPPRSTVVSTVSLIAQEPHLQGSESLSRTSSPSSVSSARYNLTTGSQSLRLGVDSEMELSGSTTLSESPSVG